MTIKIRHAAAASLVALAAAGCASAPSSQQYAGSSYANTHYPDADRVFRGGHVEATRPLSSDHVAGAPTPRALAAYEGISGARLAHKLYNTAQAERLDGACERYVSIEPGETLYDIASFCDVPVYMLMDYNPRVAGPRHVAPGQMIEVPALVNHDRLAYAQEAGLINASAYVVQPGDTLSSIASAHLAPASLVAELNPGVNWRALPVGATIRLPGAPQTGAAPTTPRAKPIQSYLGDGDFSGDGARHADAGERRELEIEQLMPYRLKPVRASAGAALAADGVLSVDKSLVSPGQAVWISANGLPANARVTIAQGPNRAQLKTVETVRTGPDGVLSARVRVPGAADAGGVLITATVDETGQTLYSGRVGVLKIEEGAAGGE